MARGPLKDATAGEAVLFKRISTALYDAPSLQKMLLLLFYQVSKV